MRTLLPLLLLGLLAGCAGPSNRVDPNEIIGIYREPVPPPIVSFPPATPAAPGTPASGTAWTADELKTWYTAYLKKEKGHSLGLLYQGSDARYHYFTARQPSTNSWTSMFVAKNQIRLEKEMPDRHSLQPPRGYDFVDPFNGFRFIPKTGTPL